MTSQIMKVSVNQTGAIKGTSQSKLYNELGFESLKLHVGLINYAGYKNFVL